jgi:hypothetical protein
MENTEIKSLMIALDECIDYWYSVCCISTTETTESEVQ